ncbi:MAG: hypothetical protein ACJAY8_001072 [Sphingobacteriales bacterium]|jgi:hypothetical protein
MFWFFGVLLVGIVTIRLFSRTAKKPPKDSSYFKNDYEKWRR